MSRKKLIVGNWKMNPNSWEEARMIVRKTNNIAKNLQNLEVVVCPPFVYIPVISPRKKVSVLGLGAQSVSVDTEGSHTGEVGAPMLKSLGVEYVIVGHSEQRERGDDDGVVSKRLENVLEAGLKGIVCVGEKSRDENGIYLDLLKEQIKKSLANVPEKEADRIVIAYEPIWAIGASEAMNPEQVYEMSLFVRKTFADIFGQECAMKVKILYGGAVTFRNATDILNIGKVDGFLVGRESINVSGFVELLKVVEECV